MKARLTLLHNTEAEWAKLSTFKPEAGELIIYDKDIDHEYTRFKIGDGEHTIQELEFTVEAALEVLLSDQRRSEIIDAGRITDYIK